MKKIIAIFLLMLSVSCQCTSICPSEGIFIIISIRSDKLGEYEYGLKDTIEGNEHYFFYKSEKVYQVGDTLKLR